MTQTQLEYANVMTICREIFEKKTLDYGLSWRILRPSSLTDQLFIKAQRIRTIQETGKNFVGESFEDAFQAIVNYCIMAIIQVREPADILDQMQPTDAIAHYDQIAAEAKALMERKNHDYGEAWRDMRTSSLTDLILSKILRIKQIEDNAGETQVSEGVEGNYFDMLNYSVFALIHLQNC
ncbi:MAG: DUF1599 domain-containing protein [Sphingomonadales bacterium]|nr:DUF1599 domain-containing protein [Sphingomonadales bacterium]